MTIANLVVRLTANAADFHAEMEKAASRIERTGRMITRIGREISTAISLPIIAAGFAAFHTMLAESARSFGPLTQAFEQLKGQVHALFLAAGRELQPVFLQIIDLLHRGLSVVQGWIEQFHQLSPTMQKIIVYSLLFLAALGPTVFAVGKVISAVGALIKILPLLISETAIATGGILALAGAGVYAATHWDRTKELLLEDVGAIVQGFFLMARGAVLALDILSLGMLKLVGVSDMMRSKLDALEDRTLGRLGGLIFEANKKLERLTDTTKTYQGAVLSVEDIMKTMNDALAANESRTQILGPRYNFLAAQAAAYGQAIDQLTALHVPLNTVLNDNGMRLSDLGEKYQFIQERAAEYERVIQSFGPTSEQAAAALKAFQEAIGSGKGFKAAADQAANWADTIKSINQTLLDGARNGIAAIGSAIGGILSGINQGFRGLGGILRGIVGGMLVDIGKALIAFGIAGDAIKKFAQGNPAAAIAAGIALIALGSALQAQAASIVSGGGGGGGSAAVSTETGSSPDAGSGTLILELRGDAVISRIFEDPRNQDAFAEMLSDLSGRQVRVEPRSVT